MIFFAADGRVWRLDVLPGRAQYAPAAPGAGDVFVHHNVVHREYPRRQHEFHLFEQHDGVFCAWLSLHYSFSRRRIALSMTLLSFPDFALQTTPTPTPSASKTSSNAGAAKTNGALAGARLHTKGTFLAALGAALAGTAIEPLIL